MSGLISIGAGRRTDQASIFDTGTPPLHIHVEGNSISDNYYTSYGSFDNHLMTVEPLASSGATHASTAATSSTWQTITDRGSSVDASWHAGATNILVVNETINSVNASMSPATIKGLITDYIAARRALHPWRVICWLTLPYGGAPEYAATNTNLLNVDAWQRENAFTLGIERVVNPRVLPVFNHDGLTAAPFEAYASSWHETAAPYTHPLDAPKLELAALIVAAMVTMRP